MARTRIKILDHGYIELVESWGSDERIIEAARMSTGKGFNGWGPLGWKCPACGGKGGANFDQPHCPACPAAATLEPIPGDEKLLKYLYSNCHDTPFEMAGAIFQIKAPIFVFREWHRHRTQSYNEQSARYTPLPNDNYMPTVERCLVVPGGNKQAMSADGAVPLTHAAALGWLEELAAVYDHAERVYQKGLQIGIPKEIARCPVPVARYSVMRASTNLRNWLAFLTLRSDNAAQSEIRQYAYALGHFISELHPRTWDLFLGGERKKPVIDKQGFARMREAA